jgi:hypothetical protein
VVVALTGLLGLAVAMGIGWFADARLAQNISPVLFYTALDPSPRMSTRIATAGSWRGR